MYLTLNSIVRSVLSADGHKHLYRDIFHLSENNGFYSMRKRVQEIGGSIHWYSDINGLNTVVEWTLA
jgi:hypothetical protein